VAGALSAARALEAAGAFCPGRRPLGATELEGGHINRSWLVELAGGRILVQALNTSVFADPEAVMGNVARAAAAARGLVPQPLTTRDGRLLHRSGGALWRALEYVEDTFCVEARPGPALAAEAGRALGRLHWALARLDPAEMAVTLPGFHDPARRLAQLEEAARADVCGRRAGCWRLLEELLGRRQLAELSLAPLPTRVVHNDAKLANVLFDHQGRAVRICDLDTVMAGKVAFDFGDLVRSAASSVPEAGPAQEVALDPEAFRALAAGYLSEAAGLLEEPEVASLADGAVAIVYEQAMRFLADHLWGDTYYRVARPGHNLERAANQAALLRCLEGRRAELGHWVQEAARRAGGDSGAGSV
jgi:Ser/Thr protein kinase RdoA (MazF antagonist)